MFLVGIEIGIGIDIDIGTEVEVGIEVEVGAANVVAVLAGVVMEA